MAKQRWINTKVWSDGWVNQLDPIEKLLFLYFLTNNYTSLGGIYELPLKVAAVETGIDPTMIEKVMPRMRPKVYHQNGWVIIPNFPKYQNITNPKISVGIQRDLALVPNEIYSLAIAYGYPIHKLSHSDSDSDSDLSGGAVAPIEVVQDKPKPDQAYKEVFKVFSPSMLGWMSHKPQIDAAKRLIKSSGGLENVKRSMRYYKEIYLEDDDVKMKFAIDTPYDLEAKIGKLIAHQKKNGN